MDIFEQLVPLVKNASSVFAYASTPIEVDTRAIIGYCLFHGIPTALPVSGDTELAFYYISGMAELKKGRYNIDEPSDLSRTAAADECSLCIVPALCADGDGLRLGYGKGYYDRFLCRFAGTSVIICYRDFIRSVPAEPHDRRADITIYDNIPY